jgi:hypothetical protein
MSRWSEIFGFKNADGSAPPGFSLKPVGKESGAERGMVLRDEEKRRKGGSPGRLSVLAKAPMDLIGAGLQSAVGATVLGVAGVLKLGDPELEEAYRVAQEKSTKKKEVKVKKIKPKSKKQLEKERQRQELVLRDRQTESWTKKIEDTVADAERARSSNDRSIGRARRLLGSEGAKEIDSIAFVNQRTPLKSKKPTESELKLAQRVVASSPGLDLTGLEQQVDLRLNSLAAENMRLIGVEAVNDDEAHKLYELKHREKVPVAHVTWVGSIVAAVMGAAGSQPNAINGGYQVLDNRGNLELIVGGNPNTIAPLNQITADAVIPKIYRAARSVARGETPLFGKDGRYRRFVRKAIRLMGDDEIPVIFPGMVKIEKTGGDDETGLGEGHLPAKNALVIKDKLMAVNSAAVKLEKRLQKLGDIADETPEQRLAQLRDDAVNRATDMPRRDAVMMYVRQIKGAGGTPPVAAVSTTNGEGPGPESGSREGDKTSDEQVVVQDNVTMPEQTRETKSKKKNRRPSVGIPRLRLGRGKSEVEGFGVEADTQPVMLKKQSQIDKDLEAAGLTGMSLRTAQNLNNPKIKRAVEQKLTVEFGERNAKRMMRNILTRAKEVIGE